MRSLFPSGQDDKHNNLSTPLAILGIPLDLIHDPIPRLLKNLALPASVGMLFSTLYYIVDNYFAGLLSASALAGLAIAAPCLFIGSAIAIGIGQATNAIVGNALGEDNPKKAAHIAGQALSFLGLAPVSSAY